VESPLIGEEGDGGNNSGATTVTTVRVRNCNDNSGTASHIGSGLAWLRGSSDVCLGRDLGTVKWQC
jgi:hypothetical protein